MKSNFIFVYIILLLCFFFTQTASLFCQLPASGLNIKNNVSQPYRIIGKVVDQNNIPIIGASIIVLGIETGTNSNINGVFLLYVPTSPVTLRVTFAGCTSVDTTILSNNSPSNIQIKLPCDHPNTSKSQQSNNDNSFDFQRGKVIINPLIKDKFQLGKFAFEDSIFKKN